MNPLSALRLMVKHHPDGLEGMAVKLDMSAEVLRKQLAGEGEGRFKLGVIDACLISEVCIRDNSPHCRAFVNTIAADSGGFVALPVRDSVGGNIHGSAAGLVKECSDVVGAVAEGMRDGTLSDNDRKAIEKELRELLEKVQDVQADVGAEHSRGQIRMAA
jgi:hypothetical protein